MKRLANAARGFYAYMGSDGGAVPYGFLALLIAVCGLGAGIGYVVAVFGDADREQAAFVGAGIGLGLLTLWTLSTAVVAATDRVAEHRRRTRDGGRPRH